MLTVSPDPVVVESQLAAGELSCPECAAVLAPWGHARERPLGRGSGRVRLRPRRGRCRWCGATQVLLPATVLLRRGDFAAVIGRALAAWAVGDGQRQIAAALGVPRSTVRGWLSRLAARAERIRAHFTRWALWLAPSLARLEPSGSLVGDAVAAMATAWEAAGGDLAGLGRWGFASAATGGRLLCNTSASFPAPWKR